MVGATGKSQSRVVVLAALFVEPAPTTFTIAKDVGSASSLYPFFPLQVLKSLWAATSAATFLIETRSP